MPKSPESIMAYGGSGSGKTHQVKEFAIWIKKKYGKKTRLVSTSGGGWRTIQTAVDAGIVEPVWGYDFKNPFDAMFKLSKGWWPEDHRDPESPLLPPDKQRDYLDVGALAFDDITLTARLLMDNAVMREAKGEIRVATEALPMKFKDGDTWVGQPAKAHYGTIQRFISQLVSNSKGLGGVFSLWTGLELKTTDDTTGKLPVYAPCLIGKAMSSEIPSWFEDTLHTYVIAGKDGKVTYRLYLAQHWENDGIPYLAKNRGSSEFPLPQYLEGADASLERFMDLLIESHVKSAEILAKRLSATTTQTKQGDK